MVSTGCLQLFLVIFCCSSFAYGKLSLTHTRACDDLAFTHSRLLRNGAQWKSFVSVHGGKHMLTLPTVLNLQHLGFGLLFKIVMITNIGLYAAVHILSSRGRLIPLPGSDYSENYGKFWLTVNWNRSAEMRLFRDILKTAKTLFVLNIVKNSSRNCLSGLNTLGKILSVSSASLSWCPVTKIRCFYTLSWVWNAREIHTESSSTLLNKQSIQTKEIVSTSTPSTTITLTHTSNLWCFVKFLSRFPSLSTHKSVGKTQWGSGHRG